MKMDFTGKLAFTRRTTLAALAVAMLPLTQALAANDAVTVGAVFPLTGTNGTMGQDQKRGADLALQEINAAGGVMGKKFNIIFEDSQGRGPTAVDVARKLVSVDKVPAVIGEFSSGSGIPLGQYLQEAGAIHMNPGSTSAKIRAIGDLSFSTIGLENVAGEFVAQQVYDMGYRKVAILLPNNAFGEGIMQNIKTKFTALGGEVATDLLFAADKTDYRNELRRMAAADPDVFIYFAYGQEAANLNRQSFELGLQREKPWFGLFLSICIANAAPETVEGQMGMDVNGTGPGGEPYREKYLKAFGEPLRTNYSGYAYDATHLLAAAINKANSTEPAAIRDALHEVGKGFAGVTGDITLDADGQRTSQPYDVVKVVSGKLELVKP